MSRVDADSAIYLEYVPGETIGQILARLGIALEETSHLFLNGELSAPTRRISADESRLGIFPKDMALLYSWYFDKKE